MTQYRILLVTSFERKRGIVHRTEELGAPASYVGVNAGHGARLQPALSNFSKRRVQ